MNPIDSTIASEIRGAIAAHARPVPARYGSGIDWRFARGNAPGGWHVENGADRRPGDYRVYARRMTVIPLEGGYGASKPFWTPSVFFLPQDASRKPERAYDGNPLERGARPILVDAKGSTKKVQDRIFAHVLPALFALASFRKRTGQRYEVLYLRERDRCLQTGESFDWTEYPVDPSTLS